MSECIFPDLAVQMFFFFFFFFFFLYKLGPCVKLYMYDSKCLDSVKM